MSLKTNLWCASIQIYFYAYHYLSGIKPIIGTPCEDQFQKTILPDDLTKHSVPVGALFSQAYILSIYAKCKCMCADSLKYLHYIHQFCFPGICSSIFNSILVCINITYINFHDIIQDRYAIKSVTLAWTGYPYREHIYLSIVSYILSLFMVSRMTACFVKILQLAEQFRMYGCKCEKSPK